MKVSTVAWLAAAAMFASSTVVCMVVPAGGARPAAVAVAEAPAGSALKGRGPEAFRGGEAVAVEARLGRSELARDGSREELVLVDLQAPEQVRSEAGRAPTSTA